MKFYGHANLQQNELQNAVLTTLTSFPASPKVGQFAFVNSIVYVCIQATPTPPIWVPLTQEITAYTHTQSTDASTWVVDHELNTTSVNVQVFGTDNKMIIPDEITIIGPSSVQVHFDTPISGKATVVSGHFDGAQKPTYAYTFYQTNAATTWTVVHNLGYAPIVRVFIGVNEVQPATVSFPDANTVVITFDTPQAGIVRLL